MAKSGKPEKDKLLEYSSYAEIVSSFPEERIEKVISSAKVPQELTSEKWVPTYISLLISRIRSTHTDYHSTGNKG